MILEQPNDVVRGTSCLVFHTQLHTVRMRSLRSCLGHMSAWKQLGKGCLAQPCQGDNNSGTKTQRDRMAKGVQPGSSKALGSNARLGASHAPCDVASRLLADRLREQDCHTASVPTCKATVKGSADSQLSYSVAVSSHAHYKHKHARTPMSIQQVLTC